MNRTIGGVIAGLFWVAGVVIAKGFWWKVLAICIPFYAWYKVVEKIMVVNGWL
jgi:hypothetical protein